MSGARGGAAPRPVDAGSAKRLAALHALCFDDAWDASSIARLLAMPGAFGFTVEDGARGEVRDDPDVLPAGLVLARVGGGEAEILAIGVAPAARGAGLGHRLLEAVAIHAAAAGADSLFLEVAEDNLPALALYERFGFHIVGIRPAYYARAGSRISARTLKFDIPSPAAGP
ncbi:MAG: GNAT family N-acetyltransferase [Parvibaculum sp.]|nr:GNAT family N-acetyltransferase [Parvibaculum sp.]